MLKVNFIRNNFDFVREGLKKRNFSEGKLSILDNILKLDNLRISNQQQLDKYLAEVNSISKEIGKLFKTGKAQDANALKEKVGGIKDEISVLKNAQNQTLEELQNLLYEIPNIPNKLVPNGNTEEDNEVYRDWKEALPILNNSALPHWELAKKYDVFDLELGTKLTGAGFPVFRKKGAKLQRALINFFLDEAHDAGYEEIQPPILVNQASATATGQLPDKEGQMYHVTVDDLYLIPTGEIPITNIYRDEIINQEDLPIKLAGYTPCFRREAGSYGSHVRGLNRVHQFEKVEIVQIQHPDNSTKALHEMIEHISKILDKLELPYRILRLCAGDLGFTSSITYDFEVYSAAQKRWLEVSSVSNFETFQANRLKLRYKDEKNKKHLVHTLNGSALALARIVACLLENNQTENGIEIPKALQPYTKFKLIN